MGKSTGAKEREQEQDCSQTCNLTNSMAKQDKDKDREKGFERRLLDSDVVPNSTSRDGGKNRNHEIADPVSRAS